MPLFDGNIHQRRDFSLQPDVEPEVPLTPAKKNIPKSYLEPAISF